YITPLRTTGTAWEPPPPGPPPPAGGFGGRMLNLHACFNCPTFSGVICASGEKRVAARSWLYVGQSLAGGVDLAACCARPTSVTHTSAPAISATATLRIASLLRDIPPVPSFQFVAHPEPVDGHLAT